MRCWRILLVDANPPCGAAQTLLEAVVSSSLEQVDIHYERGEGHLTATLSRVNPCLILLAFGGEGPARLELVARCSREAGPAVPVVVAVDQCQPEELIQLLRAGAADFVIAPWRTIDVVPRLWRLLPQQELDDGLATAAKRHAGFSQLIGNSPAFREQVDKIPLVASCDANLLILGETGSGKELFARAVHHLSRRSRKPLIPVNCGAIPADLLENELFGHESGAYTSASTAQRGVIGEADGGTLFLDEVDSLPLAAQVKLLRFLEEKEYRPLGSPRYRYADVRVIASTNSDLERVLEEGRLRLDLYYRLNVISVQLPPLRQRVEDIPVLARHFLKKCNVEFQRSVDELSPAALEKLLLHRWPGNVRELEHVIERAVALASGTTVLDTDIVFPRSDQRLAAKSFREAKAELVLEFERNYIRGMLVACRGNISRAAQQAKKNRRAFWELIRKHRIDVDSMRNLAELASEK
jgi:DNA-binding NtrC family response regulator